jgi:hypothetical protein
MNTGNRHRLLNNLRQIYPEHEWIDLAAYPQYPIKEDTSPAELNLHCLNIVKAWIEETQGFSCEYIFPYIGSRDRAIGQLLNGFCLKVNGNKIIFIPTENIDLESWEIPQEWIDLSNWLGDYYLPIQVDVEAQYLHLWGVITHAELKKISQPENQFCYYSIPCGAMNSNLDFLWVACELQIAPKSDNIPALTPVNAIQAQKLIDRAISTPTPNLPRLILPFSEWGAILNHPDYLDRYLTRLILPFSEWGAILNHPDYLDRYLTRLILLFSEWGAILNHPDYLDRYLNSAIQPTNLTDWFDKQAQNLSTYWQQIEHFLNPPQPQIAFRGFRTSLDRVVSEKSYRDIPLETPEQIKQAIAQLYLSQTGNKQIPIPPSINGVEDLITLMEKSTDDNIRWKATEYLYIINPNHPKLPIRRVRDLGLQFAKGALALMISQLKIDNQRRAILLRVYPWEREMYLPAELKLSLLQETGTPVLLANGKPFEAIARSQTPDEYIQLYFIAEPGDRFGVRVSLDTQEFTEHFIV